MEHSTQSGSASRPAKKFKAVALFLFLHLHDQLTLHFRFKNSTWIHQLLIPVSTIHKFLYANHNIDQKTFMIPPKAQNLLKQEYYGIPIINMSIVIVKIYGKTSGGERDYAISIVTVLYAPSLLSTILHVQHVSNFATPSLCCTYT